MVRKESDKMDNILLTTAGGGNANNIIRSLRFTDLDFNIIGTNMNKYDLAKSLADENYLVPRGDKPNYIKKINKIIEEEDIDLLIPNHEKEAVSVAKNIKNIDANTFIPDLKTIELCIDKFKLNKKLEQAGVNVPKTLKFEDIDDFENDIQKLKQNKKDFIWCRVKEGAGSRGAAPFSEARHISFWLDYWKKEKGVDKEEFIFSEYLPGNDYMFFSLWNNGELVIGKTCERLEYTCSKYTLSGTSSSPSVGQQVYDEKIIETCKKTVKTVDENATGIFAIDLKENKKGEACITEINIARFPRINIFFNMTGEYNMAEIYVKLGLNQNIELSRVTDDIDENVFLFRDIDLEPLILSETEIKKSFKQL